MKNIDVIRKFKNGETDAHTTNLKIRGNNLVNYGTTIATRNNDGTIDLNVRWYSRTTSTIQNYCKREFGNLIVREYEGKGRYE